MTGSMALRRLIMHAVMCGAGHNLRLILAFLRLYCARFGLSMQTVTPLLVIHDPPAAENGIVQDGLITHHRIDGG